MIGAARLLEYAIIDSSVVFTACQALYVDGNLLGPVPQLAICRDLSNEEIQLFHCDKKWNVLGVSGCGTLREIEKTAERGYRGLSGKWLVSPYSEEDLNRYMEVHWGKQRCSFCGRWPWQLQKLFVGADVGICNDCVDSFHAI